jgi:hypothetical protein
MEKEERADAGSEKESGRSKPPSGSPVSSGPAARGQPGGSGGHARTALISVAVVVVGVVLFVAGFFTHSLLDDDVDLNPVNEDLATLSDQVSSIQDILGITASPTPAPVVEATADDDPFKGPEDAPVTIIEFSDYQ